MTNWEYRLMSLASFDGPTPDDPDSDAVALLNGEGRQGWEAIGLTTVAHGECAVLMKRPLPQSRAPGARL